MSIQISLKITDEHDSFNRRVYVDEKGRRYVDINLDDDNPVICTTSKDGEPELPVWSYKIIK
tara:strand:- start:45 stop:230 length:186 start_codon:yes stop_codon:yes gene_type:complete